MNGNKSGNVTYDNACDIVNGWADINRTCVLLPSTDPKSMPQGSSFDSTQKQIIFEINTLLSAFFIF